MGFFYGFLIQQSKLVSLYDFITVSSFRGLCVTKKNLWLFKYPDYKKLLFIKYFLWLAIYQTALAYAGNPMIEAALSYDQAFQIWTSI